MTSARDDLLALTEEVLAALANRGMVRRAARELDEGRGPELEVDAGGLVTGRFPDGVVTRLPPAVTWEAASCTCAASGVCRHRIALVLAYQRTAAGAPAAVRFEPWSPGAFSDEDLEAAVGSRVMAAAMRALRAGYRARVQRPSPADPTPRVELGSCTVRFLVPGAIGYARSDAARGVRDDAVPLAVWAFRAADELRPEATEVELDVGGPEAMVRAEDGSGMEPAVALVADLLVDGAAHTGPSIDGSIAQTRRLLEQRNLRWPVDLVDAVADQLSAYRSRSARYAAGQFASLLAELAARHRCVAGGGVSLPSQVLGTEEAAETALRHLRLTGIGCRVTGDSESRTVRVFLAHGEAGVVLVLERRWEMEEGESSIGADLTGRRLAGSTVAVLAAGNVVTDSALRSAGRVVRIGTNRVTRTTVAASSGDWGHLPQSLVVRDLNALSSMLAALPPRLVRPRVEADLARVIEIGEMLDLRYESGAQRLTARIRAIDGGTATVSATHRALTPGALDALAAALAGRPRFVSGVIRRFRSDVVVEPLAVVAGGTVVVPDLAPG